MEILYYIMENPPKEASVELADNRISLYSAQYGNCFVTGEKLEIGEMEVHHKLPKELGGTDEYRNLVWVTYNVHKLIHVTEQATIERYLTTVNPNKEMFEKLNKLRTQAGNCVIDVERIA